MPKNIVIFSDGTGQEGGLGNNTNVYELFNMIEDRTGRQVSFYDRGLGTGWRTLTGNIGGGGITKNILECYEFIGNNYNAGDQIYLFGFSRGATTVRTLAAFIHRFGILPKSRPELIKRAYKIYKIRNREKRRRKQKQFLQRNHTMWCRIKFLGVWDTVAALGIPFKILDVVIDKIPFFHHSYHDFRLSKSVDVARHALAIDDERLTFHPVLWDEVREDRNPGANLEFSTADIRDIHLVATKLKEAADPVSQRLVNNGLGRKKDIQELIAAFASNLPGRAQRERALETDEWQKKQTRIEELKTALVDEFNTAIKGEFLFDPREPARDLFDTMALSRNTRDLIQRSNWGPKAVQRLNRGLLEDAYSLRPANPPRVKQVWFSGMHTDVGGGYPANELAHVPLLWIVNEARDAGLLVYPKHKVDLRPDAAGKMHNSRERLGRLYRRRVRFWDRARNQGRKPVVHESVLIRQQCDELHYEPWILKREIDVENWPPRLTSNVQFDDYYIWREDIWGFDSAFALPWSCIKRISYSQVERTIKLFVNNEKYPVVINRVSGSAATEISSAFDSYKLAESATQLRVRDEEQQNRLKDLHKNDKEHTSLISNLTAQIATLEEKIASSDGGQSSKATQSEIKSQRKKAAK